ncbi:MAG: peptidase [Roseivirga sp.]|nr:peptidase [Roseivirga sp.]MBO6660515.1 peptidase [Roseivirga sp.]MBO6762542.1 peptidase [Roseivirga sp.]MBO6906748.1 peptidase [Roseivirga sp.]
MFCAVSCSEDQDPIEMPEEISETVKNQFTELGFDVSDIRMSQSSEVLDPSYEAGNYVLENDIIITPANLEKMLKSKIEHLGAVGEQYRTTNLVSSPTTINVIGYTGGSYALDNTMRTALQWSIDNYNALNTGLTFTLTFGTNYQPYDIVVYRVSGGGGGSAGFPTNGNPYKYVQIQSGTSSFGTNVTEHVITHEIGHCLGLRHTDYFNRSLSCGTGGNEGSGGVGAIHIPGTPTGFDANSIMLSCFSSSEDGEFGQFDITALEYLY